MKKRLGIELGSTRIKAILIDENATVIAQGSYEWESSLANGLWSYSLKDVETGLQASYAELAKNYAKGFGERFILRRTAAEGRFLCLRKSDNKPKR